MSPHQSHRTTGQATTLSRRAYPGDESGGLFLALAIGALLVASLVTPRARSSESLPGSSHATCAQTYSTTPALVTAPEDATAEKQGSAPPAH